MAALRFDDALARGLTAAGAVSTPPNYPDYLSIYNPASAPASWATPGSGYQVTAANELSGITTPFTAAPYRWLTRPLAEASPNCAIVAWLHTNTIQHILGRGVPSPDGVIAPYGYDFYADWGSGAAGCHTQLQRFQGGTISTLLVYTGYTMVASGSMPIEAVFIAMMYQAVPGVGPATLRTIIRNGNDPNGSGGNAYDSGTLTDSSGHPAALATAVYNGLCGNNNTLVRRLQIYDITGLADIPVNLPTSFSVSAPTPTIAPTSVSFAGLTTFKGAGTPTPTITHSWTRSDTPVGGEGAVFSTAAAPTDSTLVAGHQYFFRDRASDGVATVPLLLPVWTPKQADGPVAGGGDSINALTPKSDAFTGGNSTIDPPNASFNRLLGNLLNGGQLATFYAGGVSGSQAHEWGLAKAPTVSTSGITNGAVNPIVQFASGSMAGLQVGEGMAVGTQLFGISAIGATQATLVGTASQAWPIGTNLAGARSYLYHLLADGTVSGLAMNGTAGGLIAAFAGKPQPWNIWFMFYANEMQIEPFVPLASDFIPAMKSFATVCGMLGFTPYLEYPMAAWSYYGPPLPRDDGASTTAWPTIDTCCHNALYQAGVALDALVGLPIVGLNGTVNIQAGSRAIFKWFLSHPGGLYEGLHPNFVGAAWLGDLHTLRQHAIRDAVAAVKRPRRRLVRGRP